VGERQQIQRARTFRRRDVARQLEDGFLVETVDSPGGRPQQGVLGDQVDELFLGDRPEPEPVGHPAGEDRRVAALTGRGEHECGEGRLLGMPQPLERRGAAWVGGDHLAQLLDELEAQDMRRVEHERVRPPPPYGLRELRERALEHVGGLEEAPRPDAALAKECEEPRGGAPIPRRLTQVDVAEPVE
jgi:hypothetical protein